MKFRSRNARGHLVQEKAANPRLVESILRQIYYDPRHPAGFSSVQKLYQAARKRIKNLQMADVKKWLASQSTYVLHKSVKLRFPRRKVLVRGPKYQFQADLMDLQNRKVNNEGAKYLLTMIDCFSRLATAIPMKYKSAVKTKEALKKAFKDLGVPKKLQTDRGTEFYNATVSKYLKEKKIIHFSTHQLDTKAQMVERFNRTLRLKIDKYLFANSKSTYIASLKDILHAYNHSKHSAFQNIYAPAEVNPKNSKKIYNLLYGNYLKKVGKSFKYKVGDVVVLSVQKKYLIKTSKTFSPTKYIIFERVITFPPTYRIKNLETNEIKPGTFYEDQLQLVQP